MDVGSGQARRHAYGRYEPVSDACSPARGFYAVSSDIRPEVLR
jgi:hypothetical protein